MGQLATNQRLNEMERRGDIEQEYSDRAQTTLEEVTLPGEMRTRTGHEIDMARLGYRPEGYEEGPAGMQGGGVPDAMRGLVPEQEPTPRGGGRPGEMQRTPGIAREGTPETQIMDGDIGGQLRLQLMGGGSIAGPGQTPQEVYDTQRTAQRGEAAYQGRREAGVPLGPKERENMRLSGGEQSFTSNAQAAGFSTSEKMLDFLYESGMVHPTVLAAMIRESSMASDRGSPTWEQARKAMKTQAVNLISQYMTDNGVTAQEAWAAQDPEIQDLVTAGEVGQDVYGAGRPGQYGTGVYGQDPEGGLLSSAFNRAATDAIRRVRQGADAALAREELERTGDPAALRAFDEQMVLDEENRMAPTLETRLQLRPRR